MDTKKKTLANGIKVLSIPMPAMESVTVSVWIKTGARNEQPKMGGISHFLEHMMFKGTKKRPSARILAEEIDSLGAQNNAATSKEYTYYFIKSRAAVVGQALEILSDILINPVLRQEDLERERGVILEEIAMYEDNPAAKVASNIEVLTFQDTSLGRRVIGEAKTVKAITKADLIKYRKDYYKPENIIISVAGGVREEEVIKLAKKFFGSLVSKGDQNKYKPESIEQLKPRVVLEHKKSDQAHLALTFRAAGRGHKKQYIESVLATVLGVGSSSRLFDEVREKRGLAYSVGTGVGRYTGLGYMETYASVNPKSIEEAIKVILTEHEKIKKKARIDKKELSKAKEYLKGNIALSLENTRVVAEFFAKDALLLGKTRTPDQVFEAIDSVTASQIESHASTLFNPQNLNLAIIGPYKDKSRFDKLLN